MKYIHTTHKQHFSHYLIYVAIFGLGLLLVILTNGNSSLQALFIILTAFVYFIWAMVHHYARHQLHVSVVVEYILIFLLGTLLTLFLFQV